MSAFVDTSKLDVWDDARENVIYIKRKMDFGTKCRVEDTLTKMAFKKDAVENIQFTLGARNLALSVHNIIGWDGPDFVDPTTKKPVACTPESISQLDPTYPLLVRAQQRIEELNTDAEAPDPNA